MSYRTGPHYSAIYDMERLDWIKACPVEVPHAPPIVFQGGPLEGVAPGADFPILPDYWEVEEPEGRYLPTITTGEDGAYIWRPAMTEAARRLDEAMG